ncbi:MAG: hypothetical protein GY779_03300 [Gammaproteobacteria bacterium]|nr:hypothetical protein [Gammaproteobacteria bacterium]
MPITAIPETAITTIVDDDGNGLTAGTYVKRMGEREHMATTASGEDVWRGNDLSPAPTSHTSIPTPDSAGEQMAVNSEHANDTIAGIGAQIVTIEYIDAAGAQQTTTVEMNGTTPVDLTPDDVRFVNDFYVSQAGSNGVAVDYIKITKSGTVGLVYDMIALGGNKSMVPHFMVPAGKKLKLDGWHCEEAQNRRCAFRIRADCTPGTVRQAGVFLFIDTAYMKQSSSGWLPLNYEVPALSILKVSAWPDQSSSEGSCGWHGRLVDA